MNNIIKIQVIMGSTRQSRFSDKPAQYIFDELKTKEGVEAELIDLRDWQLPFFDEAMGPSMLNGNYSHEIGKKWAAKVGEADAYIMITPEYNHGYTAVLKNAIDWVGPEWGKKPVGFISYGNAGGARSIEQLRQVAIELQMYPTKNSINIPTEIYMATRNEKAPLNPELFASLKTGVRGNLVDKFLNEIIELTQVLKAGTK